MRKDQELLNSLSIASHQNIKEKKYWQDKMSGHLVKSHFPYEYKNSDEKYNGLEANFEISGELFADLSRLSKSSDYALHIILTSALAVLLYKYTGNNDIIFGTPIYKQELEGEFVNTVLPLRNNLQENISFKDLLMQAKGTIGEAIEHYNYPIEILAQQLNMPTNCGDFTLFDTAVLLENIHDRRYIEHIQLNIIFSFLRTDNGITGSIVYNSSRYGKPTIERITAHLTYLMGDLLANIDAPLADIGILPASQRRQLLYDFNDTKAVFPGEQTIHQLFEEQARNTPDNMALVFEGTHNTDIRRLRYKELNQKANRLAGLLRTKGVTNGTLVGIMTTPSIEMIVAILGILKAGGGYVPFEPQTPISRLVTMMDDCDVSLLLTQGHNVETPTYMDLQGVREIALKPVVTGNRAQITDLDSLPMPDRSLVDYETYHRFIGLTMVRNSISLISSRGCPYHCAYCHEIWPKRYVGLSAENIYAEVNHYYNMGVKRFAFYDDIFNLDVKKSSEFLQMVIDNKLDVQLFFPVGLRVNLLTTEYIDLLVAAGTVNLSMALETGSPRLQKFIQKNLDLKTFEESINYICEKYPHVILELQLMHGFPTETEEEALMTLDFVKRLKSVHFAYLHILKIFPNTNMEKLALEHGISQKAINKSVNLAYHELPETLPFEKSFTLKIQADFLNNFILSRERLLNVLPHQVKLFTEDEMVQKYDSLLPMEVKKFDDLLEIAGIKREELGAFEFLPESHMRVDNLNKKLKHNAPHHEPDKDAFRILLLDLSQFFSGENPMLYDVFEPPLGLISLQTYLNREFGSKINGKIAKSRIDFDNYDELKTMIKEFNPHLIGIRALTLHKDFLHRTVSMIRQWQVEVPVILGGPYGTSHYQAILQDHNIDLVVLGEGEITLGQLVKEFLENDGKLPDEEILNTIPGISYVPKQLKSRGKSAREILMLDDLSEALDRQPEENLTPVNHARDLAYVIFTSGSTGKPKGVMVEHRSLVNLSTWHNNRYSVTSSDRATKYAGFGFDASVWEVFPYLVAGSSLHIIRDEIKLEMEELNRYFEKNEITISFLPTPICEQFIQLDNHSLRVLLTGGDKLNSFVKNNYRLINNYGPTENTVVASSFDVDRFEANIPIGKPIFNTRLYILDKNSHLQPVGVAGELCIAGDSLARGYMNHPESTHEKFVDNPFGQGDRLYRTGDLARWLEDGNIQFLGRIDHQVKIKGSRIELGEIESLLQKHGKIKNAVVAAGGTDENTGKNKYLCAYFVPSGTLTIPALKDYLSEQLPDYMVPSYFVQLDEIPLTPNGKVNRKSLPEPEFIANGNYKAPQNELQESMVDIWAEVSGLPKKSIGIHENFFDLGGDSIKIMRIISKMNDQFGVEIRFKDFFRLDNIDRLAAYVSENKNSAVEVKYPAISPDLENLYMPFPITDVQMAYLMGRSSAIELGGISTHAYMELSVELDILRLNQALDKVINRHPMMRAIILKDGQQKIVKGITSYKIEVEDLAHLDTPGQKEQIAKQRDKMSHAIFQQDQWPLFAIKAYQLSQGAYQLCIGFDPLIADAFSMMIISREIREFYNNPQLEPAPLEITFRDYMLAYGELKDSDIYRYDKEYWLNRLEEFPAAPALPLTCDPGDIKEPHFILRRKTFNSTMWRKLKNIAVKNSITPSTLLCTAYAVVLAYWSNQPRLSINLSVFNRYPFHKDVDKLVGDFTSLILLAIELKPHSSFWDKARQVQQVLFEGLEHRHYDGVEFIREIARLRNLVNKAVMPIVFTSALIDDGKQTDDSSQLSQEEWDVDADAPEETSGQTSQVLIDCAVNESSGNLFVTWNYVKDLFDAEVIDAMFNQYIGMLSQLAEGDDTIALEPGAREKSILETYNKSSEDIQPLLLHQLFARQVEKTPVNIALEFGDQTLSYQELNQKANQVAWYLLEQGAQPNDLVGVSTPRGIDTIINVMGILKAGAAYVPIDPDYPEERRNYIYNNSACKLLLKSDASSRPDLDRFSVEDPDVINVPEDLAYIIYTSGSTGKPKGTIITHQAVSNTIIDINQKFSVNSSDRILGISSMCFDLSVYDVFGALSTGAALVIIKDQRDINNLVDILIDREITIWNSVPAIMDRCVEKIAEKLSKKAEVELYTNNNNNTEESPPVSKVDPIYYWSPSVNWKRKGNTIFIENHPLPDFATALFPELYFLLQDGVSIDRVLREFPAADATELKYLLEELIKNRVLVSGILTPQEVFHPQNRLFDNTYSDEITYVAAELDKFKHQQLTRTFNDYSKAAIPLEQDKEFPSFISKRRSYREFDEDTKIPFNMFSILLSIFKQYKEDDLIRYYYASAGGLYPIDLFVYIKKGRVENMKEGLYYYNPMRNCLNLVEENECITREAHILDNKTIFDSSAISIFMIYNSEATMPKYGGMGYFYACIDSGLMVGGLTQAAELLGMGICSIGNMDFQTIRDRFKLNNKQVFIHAVEVGFKKDRDTTVTHDLSYPLEALFEPCQLPAHKPEFSIKSALRLVLLSGDWIPLKLPDKIKDYFPDTRVISLGGATEASIWSIYYPVEEVKKQWKSIPYGIPLANQEFYVLNYEMEPCPIGVPGELYIGGVGLSSGYLNNEEKTKNSFIKHPRFGHLYRTGDYGAMRREGYIEFLGRRDHQVKIKGYRIELGEIEIQLSNHPAITETVVVVREDLEKVEKLICAYYVSAQTLTASQLREHLSRHLPEYMIPTHFVQLKKIPLTPNGKVDRKALPGPQDEDFKKRRQATYVAPKSRLEQTIAEIWQEVLNLDKIGANDNFFEIGGDSLKIIELNKKLQEKLNKDIPVQSMFAYSTVRSLSKYLGQEETDQESSRTGVEQFKKLDQSRNIMKRTINKIKGDQK